MKINDINIIVLFVLFINYIQCQISIKDTTSLENYHTYADENGNCDLEFDFYLVKPSTSTLNPAVTSNGNLVSLDNSKLNVYKLLLSLSSNSPIQNKITINSQSIDYPIITCSALPTTLNYQLISNVPNKVSNSEFNLNLVISNVNKILPVSIKTYCPDYLVCTTSQVGFSNYFITSLQLADNGKNIQNTDFSIIYEFNNSNKTFSIKSPFSNVNLDSNGLNLNSYYEIKSGLKSISSFLNLNGDADDQSYVNNVFLKFSNNQVKLLTPVLGNALINDSSIGIQLFTNSKMDSSVSSNQVQLLYFSNGILKVANQVNSQQSFTRSISTLSSIGVSGTSTLDSNDQVQMVTIVSSKSNYYTTTLNDNTAIQFPLGFKSSNTKSNPATFERELSVNINGHVATGNKAFAFEGQNIQVGTQNTDSLDISPPNVTSIQFESIGILSIIKLEIADDISGFLYLELSNGVKIDSSYLVEGTLLNGKFEYIFNLLDYEYQSELRVNKLCDAALNCNTYTSNGYQVKVYNTANGLTFPSLGYPVVSLNNITSFKFNQNSIDTTNQNVFTSINFNFSNANPKSDYPPYLELFNDGKSSIDYRFNQVYDKVVFQAYWNYKLNMYQVDFTIRKNQFTSNDFIYWLVYQGERFSNTILQSKFGSNAELSISSNYADTLGPIVTSINPLQNNYQIEITQDSPIQVGWNMKIQDQFNGFKDGFIQLVSQETGKLYNISLEPTIIGLNENEFVVAINFTGNCVSQHISIKQIYLQDTGGYSTYEILDSSDQSMLSFSPLINIKDTPTIFVECLKIDESVLPSLVSLELSNNEIDVGGEDRKVKVTFEVYDNSGIDPSQIPICYLENTASNFHSTNAQLIKSNYTNSQFSCDIEIPFGFGFEGALLLSIYGVFDHSNLVGFSSKYLKDNSFPYFIRANEFTLSTPAIYSVSKFFSSDSMVTIIGRSLENSYIQVDYLQGFGFKNITGQQQPIGSGLSTNSILISSINKIGFPFDIRVINSNSIQISNSFRVIPIISGSSIINSNNNNNGTCVNQCGGIENGICTSNGCQCKAGMIGIDCLSKITYIDNYTQFNTSKPTIQLLNNNNDQLIKSIEILILREVDSGSGSVIKVFNLNQWDIVANQTDGFKYKTTIFNNDYSTTINVSTVWSSIKNATTIYYQVDIGAYSFNSDQSNLELIISNSLNKASTFQGVVCSNSKFSVDPSNSNIMNSKLTMNQDSMLNQINLVASIDNSQRLIKTSLLNSTSSNLKNGTNSFNKGDSINSLVSITIPQYNILASINSKYSVIKEASSLKNEKSTICVSKNIKKGGVSPQQKAAAGVGVVGFFIIAGIILWFFIIKPRRDAKRL